MDKETEGLTILIGTVVGVGLLFSALLSLQLELLQQVQTFLFQRIQHF